MNKTSSINGWVFIDKPKGISSYDVIRKIKKMVNIKKIGHAGTLDPLATGMLGIAFGEATKSIKYFSNIKQYFFEITFGSATDTDDVTGKIIKKTEYIPNINEIKNCLNNFVGNIEQVPPFYSAVKVNGQRAYKLARNNKNFKLSGKKIDIFSLSLVKQVSESCFLLRADCSSGTYIRSLARDIALNLGSLGFISSLRRTKLGRFDEKDLISLEKFRELVHIGDHFEIVHCIQDVLDDIPAVYLDSNLGQNFQNGLSIDFFNSEETFEPLLVLSKSNFLGVGKINKGKINPIRVFNN